MGKDRYSDDHTIEVVGDTQTVTIDENLSVVSDVEIGGDLAVTGDLDVTGATSTAGLTATSVTVSGGLTVSGHSNLNNTTILGTLDRTLPANVHASYVVGAFVFAGDWSDFAAQFTWAISTGGVLTLPGGGTSKFFTHNMNDLPDGATVTTLKVRFEPVSDTSGFEVTLFLGKMNLITGAITTVGTVTATTGTAGVVQSATTSGLSEEIDYNVFAYFLSLKGEPAADDLKLYSAQVSGTVTDYD